MCSWDSSGTSGVDCVLEDVSNTTLFLLSSVFGGCFCSGVSSGTKAVDCMLEDVSNTILLSDPQCVWRLCVQWGFKWD